MPSISMLLPYASLFIGTLLLMLVLVPVFSGIARKIGLVDKPDERRKLHTRAVPLIGGICIFLSVLFCCLISLLLSSYGFIDASMTDRLDAAEFWQLIGLVIGGTLIVVVGALDDRFGIRGRQKLLVQFVVAGILVFSGTWVQSFSFGNGRIYYGDAFTSAPAEKCAKLEFELEERAKRIRQEAADGIISESAAEEKISILDKSAPTILNNARIRYFFFDRLLASAAILLTVLWIVGAINSVNLIDGADGLAGTITFIVSLALAIVAFWTNHYIEGAISLSLAGAILGFLVFNFPPAKIFLGDAGSMLIGMVLASLAVQSYLKEPLIYICLAPLAMLFIPIFDSTTAFARRLATGRSIYSTDRGHLHHILLRHGLSNRGMILFVGGLTMVTAGGAVMTVVYQDSKFSIIGVATVIVFLVSARVFGFAEFKLLCSRIYRILKSFVLPRRANATPQMVSVQLQGSKEWGKVWNAITDFAETHHFTRIKLDLNLPWLHESFHADWKRRVSAENEEIWQTRLPLAANGRVYGRIEISGVVGKESVYLMLMLMSDLLENLEPALARLAEGNDDSIEAPVFESPSALAREKVLAESEDSSPVAP